jgi:hypothetical protein
MPMSRSRLAASIVALLAAVSLWLSAGTLAVLGGDTHRIAALPSIWILIALAAAALAAAHVTKLRLDESWPLLVTLILWLPFTPGAAPPAFLIWQGPIEAFVWLIAIAGVLASRPPQVLPVLVNPDRAPWIAAAVVAMLSIVIFSGVRGVVPGGDEPHYLAATQSLLEDFDLEVENNYANGDYLDYFPGRLEPHFLKRSTSGEIYSIHAPGVSIIVLPLFAIAGYGGAVLTMVLIAALTAAIMWRVAWRISGSATAAWFGVAGVFATTPFFFHTFTVYPEIIGGLCVACGLWLLIELADGRAVSDRALIGTGTALALLPWLHSRFAVIAAMLGIVLILRLSSRANAAAQIARFLAVPILAGAAWFAFFWMIWGSPSPTAPYGDDTSTSAAYILRGLIGLTFDQQFGVFTTAPIYLAALVGGIVLARQRPRLAVELLLVVVPYAMAVASYAMWWAGSAAPARFLVAVLPVAVVPIALVGRDAASVLLLVISMALTLPRGLVEGGRFMVNNRGGIDGTLEWITRSVDLPLALPSVHRDGGAMALRDGVIWIAIFGAAVLLTGWLVRSRSGVTRFAAASAGGVLAAVVACTIVWSLHAQPVITPIRSKLAAFAAYRPAWHRAPENFLEQLTITLDDSARLSRLPAGEYRLPAGEASRILVGRNDRAVQLTDRWRLPVMLRSPLLLPAANRLTPVAAIRPAVNRSATHAADYNGVIVYTFDELAYLEAGGFWTRANDRAMVVLDTQAGKPRDGLPISVTAGGVPTIATLTVGSWEERFELAAGQKQEVTLPPSADGVWALSIRSGAGFRPSEREPGSTDVRMLAAWVAVASQ